ncbi:mannosyl-glycoendo-beta-N-acetylglucosaminidase family protein [Francisella philomiragia subsp. philomiragia ATCC 25015]|uniref:glucosaminidase domain-containing protein n=1 Tax=Francisella philomiragia TaxID=28110 RepID=UPI0001B1BE2F|nr:mannosyl-glycoendo-beta-N-acetylglucosaminidase family protein [Francisella philomiragia subsp. philomiragia ATCC 25015]EET21183.1 peptidoglycan hydrolase [Francisella philomiragia subsp. philomiragia ATCC 25015]
MKKIITIINKVDKKLSLKYFVGIFIVLISAAILSPIGNSKHEKMIYFLESRAPFIVKKPNFSEIKDFKERKKIFIEYMLSAIQKANNEICLQREQIHKLQKDLAKNNAALSSRQLNKLDLYLKYYKIDSSDDITDEINYLDVKAERIPTSFVLAQAALESGWGTSRFSKDYNNYFGLHCFYEGCGVKAESANVYLETFNSAAESVLGYYYRLNTGSKFKDFRIIRNKINNNQLPEQDLLNTLENYSALDGDDYKNRLISVIEHNNLTQYDSIKYCK